MVRERSHLRVMTIDTAAPLETVAIVEEDRELASRTTRAGRGRADELAAAVACVLSESGTELRDLSALAVSIGPGRFTGLRVGLATAKGLAASTGIPIIAVPTLEALAESARPVPDGTLLCPTLDARRGEIYAALFRVEGDPGANAALKRVHPDAAADPVSFSALVAREGTGGLVILAGTGAALYEAEFRTALDETSDLALGPELPSPVALAGIATRLEPADPASLSPVYLRGV
jgi:tRNA threonylcarbamoyladenosine biosynthesis protein TsaB